MPNSLSRRKEAMQFLRERTNYENFRVIPYAEMADSLRRLRKITALFGNPDADFRVIHVAGTKGKGTVSTMIERFLRAGGYRTGLFTSPHLYRMEERFALDGVPCSEEDLTETLLEIRDRLAALSSAGLPVGGGADAGGGTDSGSMTFFEISLLAAFLLFRRKKVDWAVLETGLGGRFDATNICSPEITVITSLGYDHCELLGETLDKIAAEKAGIIKPNVPVVSAVSAQIPEKEAIPDGPLGGNCDWRKTVLTAEALRQAEEVVRRTARSCGAPLTEIAPEAADEPLKLALPGRHQRINAQTALTAVRILAAAGKLRFDEERGAAALKTTTLPARFEILRENPLFIIDGAHNRQSAAALADSLRERYPDWKKTLVFASTFGKDAPGMFCALFPHFDEIYLTSYSGPRAERAENLLPTAVPVAERLANRPLMALLPADAVPAFLSEAVSRNDPNRLYCFAGSFYFASMIAEMVRK